MRNIEAYTRLIENTLARQDFDHEPKELYEPISYVLSLGGKRLRPAMTLAACEMLGGSVEDAIMPAIGVEVFHNFSLLHDDIMDNASLRRGKKTVHERWNTNIAILSGDAMLVKAYQYISSVDKSILPEVLQSFSKAALEICEGQQYDMNFETQEEVSEEDYLEMIRLKTSVLLGCALEIGALVGSRKKTEAKKLYNFGVNIGMAFQIQDDLLDAFGNPEKFGKTAGGDIINDKKTMLAIHARQHASDEQQEALRAAYSSDEKKVRSIKKIFIKAGSKEYAEQKMDAYYREALAHLEEVQGDAAIKLELAKFAEWLIKREA